MGTRDDGIVEWAADFYAKQYGWAGWDAVWKATDASEANSLGATHVDAVRRLAGPEPKRILELGAGGGFTSAALAAAGHEVVAVEITDVCLESIRRLADLVDTGSLTEIAGDFYTIELEGSFDVVCYFDGFGIGTDEDQRRLLRRVASWLAADGCALIDVFTPWYWAKLAGTQEEFPDGSGVIYEEGFDPDGCRMMERMWRRGDEGNAVTQSLRCYSPADLRLLLETTGLSLVTTEPFGDQTYERAVPMDEAMLYLCVLATA